jgi:hypothetical protein
MRPVLGPVKGSDYLPYLHPPYFLEFLWVQEPPSRPNDGGSPPPWLVTLLAWLPVALA